MRRSTTHNAFEAAQLIIAERAHDHPQSPFYTYASGEMARIDATIASGVKPDGKFYETLTDGIRLMCARELEPIDPEFCNAIYGMLEDIRVQVA